MPVELLTKEDLEDFTKKILGAIQGTRSATWPARMKKKTAAAYLDTSTTQIDIYVKEGKLKPNYEKDPLLHPTTPAYFNKEDLDKIRLGV